MKLAVVTCFYSFAGYQRPVANLHRFLRQMQKDGAPVFGVEAYLPARPVHTRPYRGWKQIQVDRATQVLWHKEALINLAEKLVPEEYDAIAWIDADVWFSNPSWVRDTEAALETHDFAQLFTKAYWMNQMGVSELMRPSVVAVPLDSTWRSHPGFAWAARRDVWRAMGGLYPMALSGGGDVVIVAAIQGSMYRSTFSRHLGASHEPYLEWEKNVKGRTLTHIPGDCWHEWHGTRDDRDYHGRTQRISAVNVTEALELAPNGLYRWTPRADPGIVKTVAEYFMKRNEDGNS